MATPLTELEAINLMLSVLGESPVSALGTGSSATVDLAERLLDETSTEVQEIGWDFNREIAFPLSVDGSGNVTAPSNAAQCDLSDTKANPGLDVVFRGSQLYDRANHTYIFSAGTVVYVDMILLLDFEELPAAHRRFIAIKAARKLQARLLGSDSLHGFTQEDEYRARANMMAYECADSDITIFDHYDTFAPLDRTPRQVW